jgi:hypothetical protein
MGWIENGPQKKWRQFFVRQQLPAKTEKVLPLTRKWHTTTSQRTTSQKCRRSHFQICRLQKRYNFFYANNLLVAEFP